MLHQATELAFRAVLETCNGCCKKTHELRQLREQCRRCAPALCELFPDDPGEERRLLDILEAAYSGARYGGDFNVHNSDVALLTGRVGDFLAAAACLFSEELETFAPGLPPGA